MLCKVTLYTLQLSIGCYPACLINPLITLLGSTCGIESVSNENIEDQFEQKRRKAELVRRFGIKNQLTRSFSLLICVSLELEAKAWCGWSRGSRPALSVFEFSSVFHDKAKKNTAGRYTNPDLDDRIWFFRKVLFCWNEYNIRINICAYVLID